MKEKEFSERLFIAGLAGLDQAGTPDLLKGIGDDCAVIRRDAESAWLLTTDTLVETVHFDLRWHPAELLGRKAASVNISDVAAMGGEPRFALLSLGLPAGHHALNPESFITGFTEVLRQYGVVLVGGDTVRSPDGLILSITVVGEAPLVQVAYRSAARDGDLIWVSGFLGDAAGGLELCRRGSRQPYGGRYSPLFKAHLDPDPQVGLGRFLAGSGLINAMQDISDGLATDLAHICEASGVAAQVDTDLLPLRPELQAAAAEMQLSAMDLALRGGEDYQLVFTAPAAAAGGAEAFAALVLARTGCGICCLGRIIAGRGVFVKNGGNRKSPWVEIGFQGFDHFLSAG